MWECIFGVKNPKASRALKQALDPGCRLLTSLTRLHFATLATFGLRSWGPPWPNPGSAPGLPTPEGISYQRYPENEPGTSDTTLAERSWDQGYLPTPLDRKTPVKTLPSPTSLVGGKYYSVRVAVTDHTEVTRGYASLLPPPPPCLNIAYQWWYGDYNIQAWVTLRCGAAWKHDDILYLNTKA